jgi:hypothetical protein
MCIGICAIATQRGERKLWYKSGVNKHDELRRIFGLSDSRPQEQVDLEAHPTGDLITGRWVMHVDHDVPNLPEWFKEDQKLIESHFMDFVEAEVREIGKTGRYEGAIDLSGCIGLTSIPALTAKDWINLRGCTGLTSIPALTAKDWIDLSGCTGLKSISALTSDRIDLRGCIGLKKKNIPKNLWKYL